MVVGADEVIGDFGLSWWGAAGVELDRYDLRNGNTSQCILA